MKQIFFFILFLPLLGCNNIIKNNQASTELNCPRVFFSNEDRIYIDNSTSPDKVFFKAKLNNFAINKQCQQQENIAIIPLDILIVAQPMDILEDPLINFPVYISLLDENDKLLETQYFLVSGSMNQNPETSIFIESDITDRLEVVTKYLDTSQLVLGFMLDDKKRDLLD